MDYRLYPLLYQSERKGAKDLGISLFFLIEPFCIPVPAQDI